LLHNYKQYRKKTLEFLSVKNDFFARHAFCISKRLQEK
jgi:hypothetical protein